MISVIPTIQNTKKQNAICTVIENTCLEGGVFMLSVSWQGTEPRAGQFFLIRAARSATLLGRPISVFSHSPGIIRFLIMEVGKGTWELASLCEGDRVSMTGPLGNGWADFLKDVPRNGKPIALVSGGLGCAPLLCFAEDLSQQQPDIPLAIYAGFPSASPRLSVIIAAVQSQKTVYTTDDGSFGIKGFVTDALVPQDYAAVFSCGVSAMLKAVAEKCAAVQTPCFVSTENHMACGVGACLGCTIRTKNGNKRCCADGPVFNAEELVFG